MWFRAMIRTKPCSWNSLHTLCCYTFGLITIRNFLKFQFGVEKLIDIDCFIAYTDPFKCGTRQCIYIATAYCLSFYFMSMTCHSRHCVFSRSCFIPMHVAVCLSWNNFVLILWYLHFHFSIGIIMHACTVQCNIHTYQNQIRLYRMMSYHISLKFT